VGCTSTVLLNDGSTSGNARAPQTRNAFERSVYLIKATEYNVGHGDHRHDRGP